MRFGSKKRNKNGNIDIEDDKRIDICDTYAKI